LDGSPSIYFEERMQMKSPSANYIIRIYHCDKKRPRSIVGVVEQAGIRGKQAFNDYDELWEILNSVKQKDSSDRSYSQMLSEEKRKHRRTDMSCFIEYSRESSADNTSNGVITNMSESGICLLTPKLLKEGENILLKSDIGIPHQKATVRWSRQYKNYHYRTGLEFVA
jgi:hypothetical protein